MLTKTRTCPRCGKQTKAVSGICSKCQYQPCVSCGRSTSSGSDQPMCYSCYLNSQKESK